MLFRSATSSLFTMNVPTRAATSTAASCGSPWKPEITHTFRRSAVPSWKQDSIWWTKIRQYRTKSVWRLCTPSACKFSVIFHKNAREYIKYSLRFLFHLTKNLATHLSHNLCAVLPLLQENSKNSQNKQMNRIKKIEKPFGKCPASCSACSIIAQQNAEGRCANSRHT